MDHTVVHFEIPAEQTERAIEFYRELFGWEFKHLGGPTDYSLVQTVTSDPEGHPKRPGVNGGIMRRMMPGQAPVNYIGVENVDEFTGKRSAWAPVSSCRSWRCRAWDGLPN